MKKTDYSCFEARERGFINPIKHIKRWGRNIKHAYQRIRYGYCDRDVWSIDWWFLSVIPNMLEDLKETTHGYPSMPDDFSQALVGTGAPEEVDEERERMALQDAQLALSEHMAYKDYVLTQLAFAQAFNKLRVKKHADSGGANVQNNAM